MSAQNQHAGVDRLPMGYRVPAGRVAFVVTRTSYKCPGKFPHGGFAGYGYAAILEAPRKHLDREDWQATPIRPNALAGVKVLRCSDLVHFGQGYGDTEGWKTYDQFVDLAEKINHP